MMSRIDCGPGQQLADPLDAGFLHLDARLDVDELGGHVLGAGGGRGQSGHPGERVHHRVEVVDRHPQHHPRAERLAGLVGLGLVVGDLAAVLVDEHLDVEPGLPHVVTAQRHGAGLISACWSSGRRASERRRCRAGVLRRRSGAHSRAAAFAPPTSPALSALGDRRRTRPNRL